MAFAPDEERVVDVRALEHRNPVSPYDGATLAGAVRTVWLRGTPIVQGSRVTAPGTGRALLPEVARA